MHVQLKVTAKRGVWKTANFQLKIRLVRVLVYMQVKRRTDEQVFLDKFYLVVC